MKTFARKSFIPFFDNPNFFSLEKNVCSRKYVSHCLLLFGSSGCSLFRLDLFIILDESGVDHLSVARTNFLDQTLGKKFTESLAGMDNPNVWLFAKRFYIEG
jgi:hypothetical protein